MSLNSSVRQQTSKTRPCSAVSQETIYHPYTRPQDRVDEYPRKRIRDIERQLRLGKPQSRDESFRRSQQNEAARKALPATRRAELERELRQRQREEAIRVAEAKRLAIMRRYKKVKFVEAQKAKRRYKSARKALGSASNEEDRAKTQRSLHIAEVDKNYVQFSPLGWKYVALYHEDDDERPSKGDSKMWKRVEKAMENGTLDQLKHEMILDMPKAEPNSGVEDEERHRNGGDEDDEEGDFFE